MNPASIMKIMNAKNVFNQNHPKIQNFINAVKSKGISEGTVIEVKITKPNEKPMIANIKVKDSDLELINGLGELIK